MILVSIVEIPYHTISGHFPWLLKLIWGIFSHTEIAKGLDYVAKVARDLIKARRESGHTEKVSIIVAGSGFCSILKALCHDISGDCYYF